MALDAAHQVGVFASGAHRIIDRDAVRTIELGVIVAFQPAHHVGGDEGQHAGGGGLHGIFAEAGEGQHRGSALVDDGGHAGMHTHGIGVEPEAPADIAIDVGVRVYKAGQDQLAADIDRLLRWTRQVLAHRRDSTVAHGDIQHAVETLGRIDDSAAPQQKIVWRGLHDIHDGSLAGPIRILLVRRHRDKGRWRHAVCMTTGRTGREP